MEAIERETIINWNDAEDTVNIFTCHQKIMRKMEKIGATVKDKCVLDGRLRHVEYEIPKNKLNITLSAKRVLSTEQKEAMRERMNTNIRGR
jgi:hypothetical protein